MVDEVPEVEPIVDEPVADEPVADDPADPGAMVVPVLAPGCMAEEPDVAEPDPVAAGRSVGADGVVDVCAIAGAAAKAVATRQAAMCFFSIVFS
jgi:hypothetical protein